MIIARSINIIAIIVGMLALLYGLYQAVKLTRSSEVMQRKWKYLIFFLTLFIAGYLLYGLDLVVSEIDRRSYITSAVFFFGGIFVAFVTNLFSKTIGRIKAAQKLESINDELRYLAERDDLTKAYKRRYFEKMLKQVCSLVKTTDKSFALFYIDIDDFKAINDTFGHLAGDAALKELVDTLRSIFRETDIIARLGGDEFVALLEIKPEINIHEYAKKILKRLNILSIMYENKMIYPTVSIGIAIITQKTRSAKDILKLADAACYEAKKKKTLGGSHFSIADTEQNKTFIERIKDVGSREY